MSTVSTPMRYLWEAAFEDGHIIQQPLNDQYSKHDADAEHNPSAYRDIEDYEKLAKLMTFTLRDENNLWRVYLIDGTFEHNGILFQVHDQGFDPQRHRLNLVFFREVHKQSIDGEEQEAYINRYFFGWNAVDTTHKAVIGIEG